MDEFEARAVADAITEAAPFFNVTTGRIQHDDESQRNVLVDLDDETALLVQKEVRWSISVVKVTDGTLAVQHVFEPQVLPGDADGVAREVFKVARRFYFGDFGLVSGVADPFGRRDVLEAAIEGLEE